MYSVEILETDFDSLSEGQRQPYIEKARYLIDHGYTSELLTDMTNSRDLASQIYEAEKRNANNKNIQTSVPELQKP